MVAPFLLLFCVFSAYPIVKSLILAFDKTNGPKSIVPDGMQNFQFMFQDPDFYTAVKNTFVYAFFTVILQLPLALFLAILLNQHWLKGRSWLRLAFFSPNLMGVVFVGVLFSILFQPQYGLVNVVLHALLPVFPLDTKWLTDSHFVMPALVATSLWIYTGFNMIYFLAGLQAVDKDLYEAAMVDGANQWQQFWNVTWPSIMPVTTFVLVTATIGSFQLFELPWILLGQTTGPDNSGLTMVMYLFVNGFINGDLGYASAVGWTLAVIIMVFGVLQVLLSGTLKGTEA